jgi:hypothetical protein
MGVEGHRRRIKMSITIPTVTVVGIADCHGIESFIKKDEIEDKDIFMLKMRAMSNRHRHAIIFEAVVSDMTYDEIMKKLEEGYFQAALKLLKEDAAEVRTDLSMVKSWDLIPNPKLDPWG